MNCFYCGKKKRGANQMFYKLDQDGHEICQSCMSEGYWKNALEIIEHNKQVDKSYSGCVHENIKKQKPEHRGYRAKLLIVDDLCGDDVDKEELKEIIKNAKQKVIDFCGCDLKT